MIRNIISVAGFNIISIILNFVYRTYFIKILGIDYLGLTSAYTNILMMLSIAELGLNQAVAYHLYKPIFRNNTSEIKTIISFYRKFYFYIGLFIFFIGSTVSFYVDRIFLDASQLSDVRAIFFLMLLLTTVQYFFSYKRILIIADQKEHLITRKLNYFVFLDFSIRIIILIQTQSLITVLIWQLIIKLIECSHVNTYIYSRYSSWLDAEDIDNYRYDNIFKKLKALVFHKLGDFFVNGTDAIIIAKVSSLVALGYYSNYFLIISTANSVLSISSNAITANIGAIIAGNNNSKIDCQFVIHNLLCSMMFMFVSVSFVINIDWFVMLWLGESFLIDATTKVLMALNLLLVGMRIIPGVYKNAAGFFEQDKYAPIAQGIINLFFSIVLGVEYGIDGVLLGTLISSVLVPFWIRPYILYKHLLKTKQRMYWLNKIIVLILFFIFVMFSDEFDLTLVNDVIIVNFIVLLATLAMTYFLIMYSGRKAKK